MKKKLSLIGFLFLISFYSHAQSRHAKQNSAGWTPGGMYYELYSEPWGDSVREGNYLKLNLTQKYNDSVMFRSHGRLPLYIPVPSVSPYDVSELWQRTKRGDSLYVVQLMDTFIKRSPENIPANFKNGDSIKSYIKILEVFQSDSLAKADQERERENQLKKEILFITDYLIEKNIKTIITASGAFVEIITEGTGNLIDSGSVLSVMYTGMSFDGVVFDTNMDDSFGHTEPLEVTTGQSTYIKGFEEGLAMLKAGSVAKIYIPSMLGYGETSLPSIEPLTNLIYEVKIVSVKK